MTEVRKIQSIKMNKTQKTKIWLNNQMTNIYSLIADMSDSIFNEGVQGYVESRQFDNLVQQYESFIVEMSAKSKTFAYWSMYIKMTGKVLFPIFTNMC